GLGPYSLSYPFSDYADPITPNGTATLAFQGNNGNGAAIAMDNGTYRTTFWVFPWEAINSAANREEVLQTVVSWCGVGIEGPEIQINPTSDAATLYPDEQTTHTLTINNLGNEDLTWVITETTSVPASPAGSVAAAPVPNPGLELVGPAN